MEAPVLDHLLRTMAAVPPGRRVLVRGAEAAGQGDARKEGDARVARGLARLGLEVHAASWTDEAARRVHRAIQEALDGPERTGDGAAPATYATAAPVGALPYPEAHFGWVVVQGLPLEGNGEAKPALQALLEEARHHLRPGGWVFVATASLGPETLAHVAGQADLAQAEAPERKEQQVHGIYRRVEKDTPL